MNADQRVLDKVLSALREWGWQAGRHRVEQEDFAPSLDTVGQATLEFLRRLLKSKGLIKVPPKIKRLKQFPELLNWKQAGQALAAMDDDHYKRAHKLLNQVAPPAGPAGKALRATVAHFRGAVFCHQDRPDDALRHLNEALVLFGKDHFVTGRVLDTLGMAYAAKDTYSTAREFYERAVDFKEARRDTWGRAVSHGQLGRLALDWGDLAEAEKHFQADLELALELFDERGAALMYTCLGQVALALGRIVRAGEFLDESVRRCRRGDWGGREHDEGYAHKDRALVYLAAGDAKLAEGDAKLAEGELSAARALFGKPLVFEEGLAHVARAQGELLCARGQYEEAERVLGQALKFFKKQGQGAEVSRTLWARARVVRARRAPDSLVADALLRALDSAERCRRHALVHQIEAELRQLLEGAEYYRRAYQRARGRGVAEETAWLLSGHRETATVLFLDLQGSTDYMRVTDPEVVMMTINQMMANLADVLERHGARVTAYLGDGFMALVRGRYHARHAVQAALALGRALDDFNRPRAVLGLHPLRGRVGVSTGELLIGNVGTYNKMDFTALGTTVNLAARLQPHAKPGQPCISEETHRRVQDEFLFRDSNPRTVHLKGLKPQRVWDVVQEKDGP